MRMLLAATGVSTLSVRSAAAAPMKRPLPLADLNFLEDLVTLKRRACWASAAPSLWLLREAGAVSRITVHHQGAGLAESSHENAVAADIDAIFTGHRLKGFADIGYHFIVDYDGRVWEGRSLAYEGAHVTEENEGNIGVLVLGNFNRQQVSTPAQKTISTLVTALRKQYNVAGGYLYGHRDLGASECPGNNLYARIVKMRAAAEVSA